VSFFRCRYEVEADRVIIGEILVRADARLTKVVSGESRMRFMGNDTVMAREAQPGGPGDDVDLPGVVSCTFIGDEGPL